MILSAYGKSSLNSYISFFRKEMCCLAHNIMEFNEFLEQVRDRIPDFLLQFNIDSIRLEKVVKNNGIIRTGLVISLCDEAVSPNIYMEYYYSMLQNGYSFENVLEEIAKEYRQAKRRMDSKEKFELDRSKLEDRVFLRIVNYESNKEQLADCPYIMFNDLAVTFRYLVSMDETGIASALINNNEMSIWKVNTEYLMKYAQDNTKKLFPPIIISMGEMLKDKCGFIGELPNEPNIYVLSNEQCINGATSMIFKEVLEEFANSCDTDFYILPSSVHEVILIPAVEIWNRAELTELVREVNENVLDDMEYLSDNVYYYDRDKGVVFAEVLDE